MRKKYLLPLIAMLVFSLVMLFACNQNVTPEYPIYSAEKDSGDGGFDFPSNSYSADVVLDGHLTDDRWADADVVNLGTWDNSDVESGAYGAIVGSTADYANSKRAIVKMFRGSVGLHFGFEVKDSDVCYQELADGDPAIWTDNVLVNLCTSIDGSSIPMSDDYYFIVTAFGNNCFRRGANAAGMWGAWSGVIDYESAIHYAEDGETVLGFGVEIIIPYEQIGITADSPIGVTFRSCDRISASRSMIEREWWFKDSVHHFNTPNSYAIWGGDNQLYNYYDYQMPAVTVKGAVTDYISGSALAGVDLGNGIVTDSKGNFQLENVNANEDLVLTASSDLLLGEQSFVLSRDLMRAANGGVVTVTPAFLTVENKVTQTIRGTISSIGDVEGATVTIGEKVATVAADGSYAIECTFTSPIVKMSVCPKDSNANYDFEVSVNDAVKGPVVCDIELPVMTKLPVKFGNSNDAETLLGWTKDGLFVRITGNSITNGYGVAYSIDGKKGTVVLYHDFGTMCITDFANLVWSYALPSAHGVDALKYVSCEGKNIYQFVLPYELLGVSGPQDISIAPFEYTSAGPFSWYKDENGVMYQFGDMSFLEGYPVLTANAEYKVSVPETVLNTYESEAFGKGEAVVKFEQVDSITDGVRVTVNYTANSAIFGYGIMLSDGTNAITQLYALGYGTIDHKTYGDWNWLGNYKPAADLGVVASEGAGVVTLFYSYETLANYGLDISAESAGIKLQLFEYVTDASGNLYAIYNCMNVGGEAYPFDRGVDYFVNWQWTTAEAEVFTEVFVYEDLGEHAVDVKVEKSNSGIRFTYTAVETSNSFGYGVCIDLPDGVDDLSILYATTGNIAKMVYGNWAWTYDLPVNKGIVASRVVEEGVTISTFFLSYELLGVDATIESIGICLFEVVNGGGSQYGIYNCMSKEGSEIAIDGGVSGFVTCALIEGSDEPEDPSYTVEAEAYESEVFGNSSATAKFEMVEGGLSVTINYTAVSGLFGYGIMLSDGVNGITQLYAVDYGTVDHNVYGDWGWGGYVAPSTIGLSVTAESGSLVFFYSFETLAEYGLNITAESESIKLQLFEYVTAGSAELFGCYNCIRFNGEALRFDLDLEHFVTWKIEKEEVPENPEQPEEPEEPEVTETVLSTYESEAFGKSNAVVKFEKIQAEVSGVRVTINYTADLAVFGFGIMLSDGTSAITQLYALGYGTIDHKTYGDWNWLGNYKPAADLGVVASEGAGVVTLFYSYETLANYGLDITADSSAIKLQLFEYVTDASGNLYAIYNCMNVGGEAYPFDRGVDYFVNWQWSESQPDEPENPGEEPVEPEAPTYLVEGKSYESEVFGNSLATAKFEMVEGGLSVTINYTAVDGLWGYGIMLSDGKNAITQLYAVGYGTIDHKTYGDWSWQGNYQAASLLGIVASEEAGSISLFYSYETLASYGLNITAQSDIMQVQLFEYVVAGEAELFGCYNCLRFDGAILRFDLGLEYFVTWKIEREEIPNQPENPDEPEVNLPVVYTYDDLGQHVIDVKLEKGETGITVTYTAAETTNLFGYGICIDLPGTATDLSILFATTGNIAKMTYGNWLWVYELPSTHNIVASRETVEGVTTATMFLSYEMLGIDSTVESVGICLFEVVNVGGSQYGIYNCMQKAGSEILIDGGTAGFVTWEL